MSQWTHVNGNIRFDYLPISVDDEGEFERGIKQVFGEVIDYDHVGLFGKYHEDCPISPIPCGSEGSIEYQIYRAPRGYNVGIWGDLRDFGNDEVQEIFDWFKSIMNYKFNGPHFVRDATLFIDIEDGDDIILLHDYDNEDKFRMVVLPVNTALTPHPVSENEEKTQ